MKYIKLLILLLGINTLLYFLWPWLNPYINNIVYIGVVGPLETPVGIEMQAGCQLYINEINQQRGLGQPTFKLLYYNDNNDPAVAKTMARQIIKENKVMAVIGHYGNETSLSAGIIYKRNEIPIITAAASVNAVTRNNEWFFRIIPNTEFQGAFIANYLMRSLKKNTAVVIHTKDDYGTSLAKGFKNVANDIGLEIKDSISFFFAGAKIDQNVERIILRLLENDPPEALFLAMGAAPGAKLLAAMREASLAYPIIGPDQFSDNAIHKELKKHIHKDAKPGLFANGLFFTSLYMPMVANERSQVFEDHFLKKYGRKSSWIAACHYDAVMTAVQAIKRIKIRGHQHIREDRRKVRTALLNFYNAGSALKGITSDIYFNARGDVARPYAVAFYEKDDSRIAFLQYQQLPDLKYVKRQFQKALDGEIIEINQTFMNRVKIVYSGIIINEIKAVDISNSAYTLDFYFWFRFRKDYHDKAVKIINYAPGESDPVAAALDNPVVDTIENNNIIRVYRTIADFKTQYDFRAYPFDRHEISIRFHHQELARDKLVYVTDVWDLPVAVNRMIYKDQNAEKNKGVKIAAKLEGWLLDEWIVERESILSKVSTLGKPRFFNEQNQLYFSQFNGTIGIKRHGNKIVIKGIVVILTVLLLLIVFFIPSRHTTTRLLLLLLVLTITVRNHYVFMSELVVDYITLIENVFFVIYGFVCLNFILFVISLRKSYSMEDRHV